MRLRLALATAPVLLLLWLGIALYLVDKHRTDLDRAAQESRDLSQSFEENIRRTVEAIDTAVRALRAARAHDPDHFEIAAWERDSGVMRDLTLQLSLADRTGIIIDSNLGVPSKTLSVADRAHFIGPRDQRDDALFISRPLVGRLSNKWSVQFARRLTDANGTFDGIVVASLDPAFLSRFYASVDNGRGALLLAGQDGYLRSVAPRSVEPLDSDLGQTPLMQAAATAPHGTVEMEATADHIDRIYSWRRVDPYRLVVVVGLSRSQALADYRRTLRACGIVGAGLTIVTVLVGIGFSRNRRDLMQSREILRAAVDNISQGLLVVDPNRCVPVLNARAAELLELPEELTVPGFGFDDLVAWQLENGEFDEPDATIARGFAVSGTLTPGETAYQRTRRNGTVLDVRTKVLPTGLAVRTFTDITEREHTARDLADARDAAEAAARARAEFLAIMSHEIRTPLNGVIGVAGLLEDMDLDPAQLEYVRVIRQSGDHLLALINDILDFSRLDADRVQLEETAFDPFALAQGVVGMFLVQASTKGLSLSAIATDPAPPSVMGDPGRLRQVLLNLVGNAVKFTGEGWVTVTLAHEPVGDEQVKLLFSVADSGIGIDKAAVERMFEAFTQMDASISRRFGGSGLGLAISRRLVELMGGTIGVESRVGAGSTFRFDVTLKRASKAPAPALDTPEDAAPVSALRILLAEDNPTNRLVARRMIERLGHRVDTVGNGAEAIAALALARYDLVLMDVMMPEMDGLTATRQIRAAERKATRLPIVGLTAGSSAANLNACLEAGMDAVTTKPVTLASLRSAIDEGRAASGRHSTADPPEGQASRLRELAETLGEDAVAEIIQAFREDTEAALVAMRAAAVRGDGNAIYRCAHSFAGAARNIGADALAQRASTLEQTVGSISAARIDAELAALQAELDVVLEGLAGMTAIG